MIKPDLNSSRLNLLMVNRNAVSENHGFGWVWTIVPSLLISIALGGAVWMAYPS